jgi:hypothetical protein
MAGLINIRRSGMTNEEWAKALLETQDHLIKTQNKLIEVTTMVVHLLSILKTHHVIDDLDISYIQGKLTDEEYVQEYKKQNDLGNMFASFFNHKLEKMSLVEKTENEWIKKGGKEE